MKAISVAVSLALAAFAALPTAAQTSDAPAAASVRVQLTFADLPGHVISRFSNPPRPATVNGVTVIYDVLEQITYPSTLSDLRAQATDHRVPVTFISGPAATAADGQETVANDEHTVLFGRGKTVSDIGERVTLATMLGYTLRVHPTFTADNNAVVTLALDETAFIPAADPGRDADQIVHRAFSGSNQFASGETRLLGAWDKGDGQTHLVYATVTVVPAARS